MSTPSDAEILALAQQHLKAFAQFTGAGEVWFEGEVEFARAVLAKWGAPPPVVREPLTADDLRMPKDGQQWRVEWWNESCRMLLPANKKLDSFQAYKTGTLMFTIKERGTTQKGGQHER